MAYTPFGYSPYGSGGFGYAPPMQAYGGYGYGQPMMMQQQAFGYGGGGGGAGYSAYGQRSAAAMLPYDFSSNDYTAAVYNSQPHDLRFGGTAQSLYHEYKGYYEQERDPVFKALLRMEKDNAWQSWQGTTDMGHYDQTMNGMVHAGKLINKRW